MELERLRSAAKERAKWEAKEDRLITLLQQLQQQLERQPRHMSGLHTTVSTTSTGHRAVHFTPDATDMIVPGAFTGVSTETVTPTVTKTYTTASVGAGAPNTVITEAMGSGGEVWGYSWFSGG